MPTIYLIESAGDERQSLRVLTQTNLPYLPKIEEPGLTLIKEQEITRRPLPLFAIDKQADLILIDASVIVVIVADKLGIQTSWVRVTAEPVQS